MRLSSGITTVSHFLISAKKFIPQRSIISNQFEHTDLKDAATFDNSFLLECFAGR